MQTKRLSQMLSNKQMAQPFSVLRGIFAKYIALERISFDEEAAPFGAAYSMLFA